MGVGWVRSCYIYQGCDHIWEQIFTVVVLMQSNWLGGTDRTPVVGCSKNRITSEKQEKSNSNSLE